MSFSRNRNYHRNWKGAVCFSENRMQVYKFTFFDSRRVTLKAERRPRGSQHNNIWKNKNMKIKKEMKIEDVNRISPFTSSFPETQCDDVPDRFLIRWCRPITISYFLSDDVDPLPYLIFIFSFHFIFHFHISVLSNFLVLLLWVQPESSKVWIVERWFFHKGEIVDCRESD